MTRRCPAAAYLSTMSGEESSSGPQSSSLNTNDLVSTRSFDHKKAFLRDMVDFMYRCHSYVKKAKEEHPRKEFKMSDAEKKDHLQEILSIISQREKESKAQRSGADVGQAKTKIQFDPRGQSSPVSTYAGQTQLTGSPVSPIINLMGDRDYPTMPNVYKSTQGSSGFSTISSQLPYGVSSSSPSTDAGSPVRRLQAPRSQSQSPSYPSYSSYPCPYRKTNMASYGSSRGYPSLTVSPAMSYQRSYSPAPMPQNATAQTSFYEYARGAEPVEYYEEEGEVDMNDAFITDDEDAYAEYDDEDVQDVDYSAYATPSAIVRCACK